MSISRHKFYNISEHTRQCIVCFDVETFDGVNWIHHPREFDFLLNPDLAQTFKNETAVQSESTENIDLTDSAPNAEGE